MTVTNHEDLKGVDPETFSVGDVPVDVILSGLESDDNLVRKRAATLNAALAAEDVDLVLDHVDLMLDLLDDERAVVVRETVVALMWVAEEHPEALENTVGDLVGVLRHDLPLIQNYGSQAVRLLAAEHPEWFVPHVEALLDVIEDERMNQLTEDDLAKMDQETAEQYRGLDREEDKRHMATRTVAGHVVIEAADVDPEAVAPYADRLIDLLTHDSLGTRTWSAATIGNLAQYDRNLVTGAVAPLCDMVDNSDEMAAANAITALGHVGDERAVEPLRDATADDGVDEDVRALASETADFLEA